MSQLFYAPGLPDNQQLPESESHHIHHVLRKQSGEHIEATDGRGNFYLLRIVEWQAKRLLVEVIKKWADPSPHEFLILAVAPTKQIDRYEWMVEKCIELGATQIIPVVCQRSERRRLRKDRLERIALAAMKQSLHSRLPEISDLTPFPDLFHLPLPDNRLIAHCGDGQHQSIERGSGQHILLVGPEGDFSPEEVKLARENGFQEVQMGAYRLRTETAALYGAATLGSARSLKK